MKRTSVQNTDITLHDGKATHSTYCDIVTVRSVTVTPIRKIGAVGNLGLGFRFIIGCVAHGPTSIV